MFLSICSNEKPLAADLIPGVGSLDGVCQDGDDLHRRQQTPHLERSVVAVKIGGTFLHDDVVRLLVRLGVIVHDGQIGLVVNDGEILHVPGKRRRKGRGRNRSVTSPKK